MSKYKSLAIKNALVQLPRCASKMLTEETKEAIQFLPNVTAAYYCYKHYPRTCRLDIALLQETTLLKVCADRYTSNHPLIINSIYKASVPITELTIRNGDIWCTTIDKYFKHHRTVPLTIIKSWTSHPTLPE